MQFLIYVQRFATEVLQHITQEKRKRKEDSLMQENLGKRVLLSITAWEPLMMLGAVGLSLIRQLRKQTLTKQSFWRIAFFNYVNNLMDQWQQRQIGCFLIRGKYVWPGYKMVLPQFYLATAQNIKAIYQKRHTPATVLQPGPT